MRSKTLLTLFLLGIPCISLFAFSIDTLVTKINGKGEIVKRGDYTYTRKAWQHEEGWQILVLFKNGNIRSSGFYKDKELTVKHGIYTRYFNSGQMDDSCLYQNNLKLGFEKKWYQSGKLLSEVFYQNDLPNGTHYGYFENGSKKWIMHTDSLGNGEMETFNNEGFKEGVGKMMNGKKSGDWIYYYPDGKKAMELTYQKDSVTSTMCFNNEGNPVSSPCIFEKEASYPGGMNAYQRYIGKNLKYPEYGLDRKISGQVEVEFTVKKDGTLGEYRILKSPHISFSQETLKLLGESPKWEPAIWLNQPIDSRVVRVFSFNVK